VAAALAAVALAGCGAGRSAPAQLVVTEQYGERPVAQAARPAGGGGARTILDLIAGVARVRTTPRGAIAALDGQSGAWAVYVNGILRTGDVAHAQVHPGDRVWVDRRTPGRSAAVVGSFPEPFLHGQGGKRLPVRIECAPPSTPACDQVAHRLTAVGVIAAEGGLQTSFTEHTLRVLVGPWAVLKADEAAALLGGPPQDSGVFARFASDGRTLALLDATGATRSALGPGTGLVAATRLRSDQPVWVVTGTDGAGVLEAARALDEGSLLDRYALAVHQDLGMPVPARPRRSPQRTSGRLNR
jgi:hypothetical protein